MNTSISVSPNWVYFCKPSILVSQLHHTLLLSPTDPSPFFVFTAQIKWLCNSVHPFAQAKNLLLDCSFLPKSNHSHSPDNFSLKRKTNSNLPPYPCSPLLLLSFRLLIVYCLFSMPLPVFPTLLSTSQCWHQIASLLPTEVVFQISWPVSNALDMYIKYKKLFRFIFLYLML